MSGYRYRNRPGWPDDPSTRDDQGRVEGPKGGAKTRQAARLRRSAEYGRLRDEGVPREEAGAKIGVARKTIARYEAEWAAGKARGACAGHDWQPEPDDPEGRQPMHCYRCGTTEQEAANA